jgi:hypothetical protein
MALNQGLVLLAKRRAEAFLAHHRLTSIDSRNSNLFHERHTSEEMARLASYVLNQRRFSYTAQQLAGSVLSQHALGQRITSAGMAVLAGRILRKSNSAIERKLAASVLSQYQGHHIST